MSEVANIISDLLESLRVLKTVSNPEATLAPEQEDSVRSLIESVDDNDL